MGFIRLRLELRAVRNAINELRHAIEGHSKAVDAAKEAQNEGKPFRQPTPVIVSFDDQTVRDAKNEDNRQYGTQEGIKKWTRRAVIAASIYAAIAAYQGCQMRKATVATEKAAVAADKAATTAENTFNLTYRPRLRILGITANQETVGGGDGSLIWIRAG